MTKTIVIDTTEKQESFFETTFLKIPVYRLSSFKIDIYNEGNKLSGTCSFYSESEFSSSGKLKDKRHIKTELKNIHVLNDTLLADLKLMKSVEIKIARSGDNSFLIMPKLTGVDLIEKCNEFAQIKENEVIYKSYIGSDEDTNKVTNSNSCSVKNKLEDMLSKGYKKDKESYLKSILSSQDEVK